MSVIDLNVLNQLKESAGEDFVSELLDAFFEDAPKQFAALRSALAAKDAETFRRTAHTLKSNGATFGALEFAGLAGELEKLGRENNLEVGSRIEFLLEAFERMKSQLNGLK
jgi:HPt (histidine-containing phosphotransfer) domain-containing protein